MSIIKEKKTVPAQPVSQVKLFGKENYMWMAGGLILMTLGFFLMAGGKSPNAAQFDPKEVYSTTRITIAPILIVAGLVVEIFAIVRKPKHVQ